VVSRNTGDAKAAADSFIVALEIKPLNTAALDDLGTLARDQPDVWDFDATYRELEKVYKKRDDAAPTSISPSGLLGWAARHGRTWSPIGVALMFLLVGAGVLYAINTDSVKALVAAWRANTAEVKRLETKVDTALMEIAAIREELKVQGQGNATKRIVVLEDNVDLVGKVLVKLNGSPFNDSFPGVFEGSFTRPPDAPPWLPPMFVSKHQWRALRPD
jgi:hypothetical protein